MRADQVIRTVNAEWSVWKVIGKSSGLTAVIEVNLGPVNDLAVGRRDYTVVRKGPNQQCQP